MVSRSLHVLRAGGVLGAVTAAGGLLRWAAPATPVPRRPADVPDWISSTPPDQLLTVLAAGTAWLLVGWLTVAVAATALSSTGGAAGRVAGRVADRVTPALLRSMLRAALGVTVAGASLGPTGAATLAVVPPTAAVASERPLIADDDAPGTWLPSLDRPATVAGLTARPAHPPRLPGTVVVAAGESLWSITARTLGPSAGAAQIAARWPRWYAANRAVIGPDPNLLRPGQRLHAPPGAG